MTLPNHHAIFLEGEISRALDFIRSAYVSDGINLASNPDVLFVNYNVVGIDEAKELISMSSSAPIVEKKKTIVLSFDRITLQAQNALLKNFEEPNPSSVFVIAARNANTLIPTLRSRLYVMSIKSTVAPSTDIPKFLETPLAKRMLIADKMLKAFKESGDRSEIRSFLTALHYELEKKPRENAEAINASARALSNIDNTSPSIKLLLEGVVLCI